MQKTAATKLLEELVKTWDREFPSTAQIAADETNLFNLVVSLNPIIRRARILMEEVDERTGAE